METRIAGDPGKNAEHHIMKHFIAILLAMSSVAAQAEENFKATNTYVTETKAWPVDQATGYCALVISAMASRLSVAIHWSKTAR